MSLVWDAKALAVDNTPDVGVELNVATVEISVAAAVPNVTLDVPNTTETVQVEIPGVQGPPGLQNVFIQETNPAIQYGWGPEDAGKIWIPLT